MATGNGVPLGTTHKPGREPFEPNNADLAHAARIKYNDSPDVKSGLERPTDKTVGGKNA